MPTVKITAGAEEDLREIWAYVAERNVETASKLIKEITCKFALLRDHPTWDENNPRFWSICEASQSEIISFSINRSKTA